MRVAILGAGPAGLYGAYLLKRSRPDALIEVFEQNPADATFGFGVVFSDQALAFLRDDDPGTVAAIEPLLERWDDITLVHRGERIRIDGVGFAAVGRLALLKLLQARVATVGVVPNYNVVIDSLAAFDGYDLVVAADGVNSLVRRTHEAAFGARIEVLTNRFAWFGTTRPFDTLTQTFRETPHGFFNAHHYRYQPDMSTFIVEVDEATFHKAGFDTMPEEEARAVCEEVFAEDLQGRPLVSNRSIWRRFPNVRNERWHTGNRVLVGDALRTAHFSIGSGTRLALEDVIALRDALDAENWNIAAALPAYEAARRPIVEKLLRAADASAAWYERFPDHMQLDPWDFAYSYITRSGRVDHERLRALAPKFVAAYEAARPRPAA
jgi:2-polyprenyl-6-methoxyphenol hydroxylase-like FAD-dependent oxidoreductase